MCWCWNGLVDIAAFEFVKLYSFAERTWSSRGRQGFCLWCLAPTWLALQPGWVDRVECLWWRPCTAQTSRLSRFSRGQWSPGHKLITHSPHSLSPLPSLLYQWVQLQMRGCLGLAIYKWPALWARAGRVNFPRPWSSDEKRTTPTSIHTTQKERKI